MPWKPANQPSRVPSWIPGPVRWAVKWGMVAAAIVLVIAMYYVYLASQFDMKEVAKMPERTVILDRHGEEFALMHGARRRSITRDEIPDVMVQALCAREDLRFFDHSGIDGKGLARATLRNIKDMSFTQGASTLTMQLARNSYDMRAKSLHRKFLEIALTLRIERFYTKDEILTHYLNRIYFGSGCHGVEEASQTYFGRPTSELHTGECAMLVGIIRGPHIFSPFRNLDGAMEQRDEVLARMVKSEFLTDAEARAAKAEDIRLLPKQERSKGSSYIKESIRNQLQMLLEKHDIRDGGLRIYTTVDAAMQRRCEQRLSQPIAGLEKEKVGGLQAAMVQLDLKSGGVLALCGGRSFQKSSFNRVYRAKRDLGPAYAPFLSALALERGKVAIPGKPVQTGRQLGVKETIRLSKRLGFSGPFLETEDLYRGSIAVSPMELAVATSVLANRGKMLDPHFILKITDVQGRVLYTHQSNLSQPISGDAAHDAYALIKPSKDKKRLVATTGSRRDAWGVEVESSTVTVVWLGYDQPQKIGDSKVIKKSVEEMLDMALRAAPEEK